MARRRVLKLSEDELRFNVCDVLTEVVLSHSKPRRAKSIDEVYTNVKCILMSEKKKLTVSELLKEYQHLCHCHLPYKDFGFQTAGDLLLTFNDILTLEEEEDDYVIIVKDPIKETHIYKLVTAQRDPMPKPEPFPDETKYKTALPFIPFPAQDMIRVLLWENSRGLRSGPFYAQLKQIAPLEHWEIDIGPRRLFDNIPHLVKVVDDVVLPIYPLSIEEVVELHVFHKNQYIAPLLRVNKIEKEIGKNIEKLVQECELRIEDVVVKYLNKFKKELKYQQLGFRSLEKFLTVVPGKFSMQHFNESYTLKYKKDSEGRSSPDVRCCNSESCIRDSWNVLKSDIRKLLANKPEGININHIPFIYEETYLRKMIIRGPLLKYFEDLQDQNVLRVVKEDGNFIARPCFVHAVQKPKSTSLVCSQSLPKFNREIATVSDVYREIPPLPLNKRIKFVLTYLESPNCFFVQTCKCEVDDPYYVPQCVIDEKMEVYQKEYRDYVVKDICSLHEGMPIAFCWKGKWHRGIVLEGASALNNKAKLYDVDKGETLYLVVNALCYLLKPLITPTPLAIKAAIADEQLVSTLLLSCSYFELRIVDKKEGQIYLH